MKWIICMLTACLFFSCEKKELPVAKYDRGDVLTTQIEMGSDYRRQVWFSLHDNKIVSVNLKTDWDLAFETGGNDFHVFLNGAKAMKVYKTVFTDLAQVKDTVGIAAGGKADVPSGNADSTAIGNWPADHKVYIVNRGYNENGLSQGFYKLKINSVDATHYAIEYGDVSGSSTTQAMVNKNTDYNFVMFSLSDHAQKQPEPKRTEYDLCFTQYTHVFTNPFQYYQVTGVLSNSFNTRVAIVKDKAFTSLTINDTVNRMFYTTRNAIGYDWKSFNLNSNLYTLDPAICYLIGDNKGYYYKLHFIDFVNTSGEKGFPKFEFKKL